tara:strand:- start:6379 stop:6627 length:249 start_codon:yes stop_codon:yes gene_type:complete
MGKVEMGNTRLYKIQRINRTIRKIQIMKEQKGWALSIGLYPGLLIGFRSYDSWDRMTHVAYLPFIDLALEVFKEDAEEEEEE